MEDAQVLTSCSLTHQENAGGAVWGRVSTFGVFLLGGQSDCELVYSDALVQKALTVVIVKNNVTAGTAM